jgi:hypothetical protein
MIMREIHVSENSFNSFIYDYMYERFVRKIIYVRMWLQKWLFIKQQRLKNTEYIDIYEMNN